MTLKLSRRDLLRGMAIGGLGSVCSFSRIISPRTVEASITPPFAPAPASAPHIYAITNARVVRVSSPTVEDATIVIRNGLIEAVGREVSAPADARIVEGKGLTVYPGF